MTGPGPTWEAVIGLEIHVQLATASKAFSASAVRFGAEPNTLTDPTVLGLPGALPVFNRRAAELAVRLGLAVGAHVRPRSRFARKHYFYPDLPKGYQISQFDEPICEGGAIDLLRGDEIERVPLTRIHLEEDAGKSSHLGGNQLVDLDRAGVPLVEVVTEPALRSAADAAELMRTLHRLVRWLGIGDGDLEKGQLRCDANVSIRPAGTTTLGTRTELKNINSFRFVHDAVSHEIARQIRIVSAGGRIVRETRLWDADLGASATMRTKEEADDYRYLPDPDLPPLVVSEAALAAARAALPELPTARFTRLRGLGLTGDDARQLLGERAIGDYFDAALAALPAAAMAGGGAKLLANWMLGELAAARTSSGHDLTGGPLPAPHLAHLVGLIVDGTLSGKLGKEVFAEAYRTGVDPAAIVDARGLRQISDEAELERIAATVLAANQGSVASFRAGKEGLLGFFVGQVMKATAGRANPAVTQAVLRRLLSGSNPD
ncbi:MAG: Asp-tRNA(Asn)/Glu-tRNA(Gln) amidotransferase subunit GatB [Kofleriaceae bacterium]|jgi:aspartyl-tRNA(Asn)/glutamyl-tRNA(Gln) amidotransferase subunit B|nr:Asp-tRNA(Asn)/Glu-tRNA(Gln) amidotransferase subunit GatB [Kofleriaceae bacterium]